MFIMIDSLFCFCFNNLNKANTYDALCVLNFEIEMSKFRPTGSNPEFDR